MERWEHLVEIVRDLIHLNGAIMAADIVRTLPPMP